MPVADIVVPAVTMNISYSALCKRSHDYTGVKSYEMISIESHMTSGDIPNELVPVIKSPDHCTLLLTFIHFDLGETKCLFLCILFEIG